MECTVTKPTIEGECSFCDGMGLWYGMAPHIHDMKITGSILGSTVFLPKNQWPSNFLPDPDCEGFGTWICKDCQKVPISQA